MKHSGKLKTKTTYGANSSVSETITPLMLDDGDSYQDVKIKSNTPDYWKRKSSGELLPVNNYSRTVVEGTCTMFLSSSGTQVNTYWPWMRVDAEVSDFAVCPVLKTPAQVNAMHPLIKDAVNQRARQKLNEKVANVIVDLPTELGEAGQTVRLIKGKVDQMLKYANDFRNQKRKWCLRGQQVLKDVFTDTGHSYGKTRLLNNLAREANDVYLEYQFGWKPLYASMEDLSELLRKQLWNEPLRRRIIGGSEEIQTSITRVRDASFNGNSACPRFDYDIIERWSYACYVGGILLDPEVRKRTSLKTELGLDLSNLLPALWELTTLSFVVDYFLNVQGLLSNFTAGASKMESSTLFQSTLLKHETTIEFIGTKNTTNTSSVYWTNQRVSPMTKLRAEDRTRTVTIFNRSPTTALNLIVTPAIRVPTWDHVQKTLSVAFALLEQGKAGYVIRR